MKNIGRVVQKQLLPGILGLSFAFGSISIPYGDTSTAKAADTGKAAQEGDTVYNVTDFGADGSDTEDDHDAIDAALLHGKNITLKDMTMQNCSYHYVNISGVDGALIENVTFKDQVAYTGD